MFDSGGGTPEPEGGPSEPEGGPSQPERSELERLAELLDGVSAARSMLELAWDSPHALAALRIAIAYEILFGEGRQDSDPDRTQPDRNGEQGGEPIS